jgi:hypothetical protein
MVRNAATQERFEAEFIRNEPADIHHNLAIVEALAREAEALGVFRRKDRSKASRPSFE